MAATGLADWAPGEMLGPPIPAHAEALRAGGPAWLTEAFRATGALASDNRVTRITEAEERLGGGTGRKLALAVEYDRPQPGLPDVLFVKFSRDPDDAVRDSLRHQMESEVRFALLSRAPGFPITAPVCVYADYHLETGTGVLITERIPFGTGGIERAYEKCLDYEIPDPLAHYRALLRAVARLAGAHKAGRLPDGLARHFPFDLDEFPLLAPIRYTAQQLKNRVARFAVFAEAYPQLLPAGICDPEFLAGVAADASRFLEQETAIKRFLHADPDFIALCHWNANVDNAWFWRPEDEGELAGALLECGLLDWGGVTQMSVAFALYGALSAAEPEVWNDHLDELLALFAAEYSSAGGPALDPTELKLHLQLFTALMGLAWLLDAPPIIQAQVPNLGAVASRFDPGLRDNETARMRLHMITMFLNNWREQDFGSVLDRFIARRIDEPAQAFSGAFPSSRL
jgi:hypothetical protein